MKHIIKRVACVLFISICIINTYRMFFMYNKPIPDLSGQIKSSSANNNQCWQGDYYIYHKYNNLSTFPYIFGTRMYLCSVNDDSKYLIHKQLKPLTELLGNTVFFGNHVLDVGGVALDMPSDNILITLNHDSDVINLDCSYNYAFTNKGILYIGEERDDKSDSLIGYNLYCYDTKKCRNKIICEVAEWDELRFVVHDKVFISNEDEDAYIYNLNTREKKIVDYSYLPAYIIEKNESEFFGIFHNGDIWEYDTDSLNRRYICTLNNISLDDSWDISAGYINGDLYIINQQGEIVKIYVENQRQESLISIEDVPNHNNLSSWRSPDVFFCDSNIVYIAHYKQFCWLGKFFFEDEDYYTKSNIFTFDYDGNLIKKEGSM